MSSELALHLRTHGAVHVVTLSGPSAAATNVEACQRLRHAAVDSPRRCHACSCCWSSGGAVRCAAGDRSGPRRRLSCDPPARAAPPARRGTTERLGMVRQRRPAVRHGGQGGQRRPRLVRGRGRPARAPRAISEPSCGASSAAARRGTAGAGRRSYRPARVRCPRTGRDFTEDGHTATAVSTLLVRKRYRDLPIRVDLPAGWRTPSRRPGRGSPGRRAARGGDGGPSGAGPGRFLRHQRLVDLAAWRRTVVACRQAFPPQSARAGDRDAGRRRAAAAGGSQSPVPLVQDRFGTCLNPHRCSRARVKRE